MRSRIVAKDLKKRGMKRDDLFAATPPLEAKKALISMAVAKGKGYDNMKMARKGKKNGMKLVFIDVRKAYFHADAQREMYIVLPDEDSELGMRGRLLISVRD